MTILTRLTRLFRADLHALLDRVEEPDLLLRQSLREMDDAHAEATRRLQIERGRRAAIGRRQQQVEAMLAGVPAELALCFEAGNEALARVLLRRRLEGERLLAHLQRQCGVLDAAIDEQQAAVVRQREQLDRLREQAELQTPDGAADDPGDDCAGAGFGFGVSDADVELALLRERRRAS